MPAVSVVAVVNTYNAIVLRDHVWLTRDMFVTLGVETDPNRAPDCDPNQCVLPDCFCSADGTRIPGGLEPSQVNNLYTNNLKQISREYNHFHGV